MTRSFALAAFLAVCAWPASAQDIRVLADEPQHVFEGAGTSFGLFLNNYVNAGDDARAELVRLIAEDLDLRYLQDYTNRPNGEGFYPNEDLDYFDRRANFVKDVRAVRPDVQFSVVTNSFPDELRTDLVMMGRHGKVETYRVLDTDDPEIYEKLADWYFQIFRAYDARGVSVEILNAVNEPDLLVCGSNVLQCRTHHYGYDGDNLRGVAEIFAQAVPAFKAKFADPAQNPTGMPVPRIMGPSTFAPGGGGSNFEGGALAYVRYFKNERPGAWDHIDIVATHQYENGVRGDLFQALRAEADGKPIHQSETHGSRQFLEGTGIRPGLSTALSFAQQFGAAVNFGTSAWYYFQTNYPNPLDDQPDGRRFNPGGLISLSPPDIPDPVPYKQYYAFRQLTSAQPLGADVLDYTASAGRRADVVAFRKAGENTVYVSVTNTEGTGKPIDLTLGEAGGTRVVTQYTIRRTDAANDDAVVADVTPPGGTTTLQVTLPPYSVNTFTVAMGALNATDGEDGPDTAVAALLPAAPNPTAGPTTLRYRLAEPADVELVVYDVLGKQVARVVDRAEGPGTHRVPFDASGLAAGVYVVRLRAGAVVSTQRVVVTR